VPLLSVAIFATYISFRMTYDQNEKQYKDAEITRENERRFSMMPYINFLYIEEKNSNLGKPFPIKFVEPTRCSPPLFVGIQNIGSGNAINVKVSHHKSAVHNIPNVICSAIYPIEMFFPLEHSKPPFFYDLDFQFQDLQNRQYKQTAHVYTTLQMQFLYCIMDPPVLSEN
jgi:hypothetical protein